MGINVASAIGIIGFVIITSVADISDSTAIGNRSVNSISGSTGFCFDDFGYFDCLTAAEDTPMAVGVALDSSSCAGTVCSSGSCWLMARSQQALAAGTGVLFASSCNFVRFASSGCHDAAAS